MLSFIPCNVLLRKILAIGMTVGMPLLTQLFKMHVRTKYCVCSTAGGLKRPNSHPCQRFKSVRLGEYMLIDVLPHQTLGIRLNSLFLLPLLLRDLDSL